MLSNGTPTCREVLVGDVVRTCRLERAAAAVDAALQCIFQLAVDPRLQVRTSHLAALTVAPVSADCATAHGPA